MALIRYLGGKGRTANKIVSLFPKHLYYLDLFGGAANLIFAKEVAFDIYNDIDDNVVNLFRVLKDKKKFKEFKRIAALTPVSRKEFYEFVATYEKDDDVMRAFKFFYIMKNGFGGKNKGQTYGENKKTIGSGVNKIVSAYLKTVADLDKFASRLLTVTIECLDFRECFLKYVPYWEYSEGLVYIDPPYYPEVRKGGEYRYEMTHDDHEELLELVNKYKDKSKIIIQGYDNELYKRELENKGWNKITYQDSCHLCGKTYSTDYVGTSKISEEQKRVECLWFNYDVMGGYT